MEKSLRSNSKMKGELYNYFKMKRTEELKAYNWRLKEEEILEKINREWPGLTKTIRETLSIELKEKKLKSSGKKTIEPEQQNRSQINDQQDQQVIVPGKNIQEEKKPLVLPEQIKQKGVTTLKEEYQRFYQYSYEKLTSEHPKWTPNQITFIIKLLWRRRIQKKNKKSEKIKTMKALPAKLAFKKAKIAEGYEASEINKMWSKLPFESKRMWRIKGQNEQLKARPTSVTMSLKSGQVMRDENKMESRCNQPFGFLSKSIKRE